MYFVAAMHSFAVQARQGRKWASEVAEIAKTI